MIMTKANQLPKTQDEIDLKDNLALLLRETFGPVHAAKALHAEISRLHAEDEEGCPAIEAHLASLGILLNTIYLSTHEMKVLTDG
jgi:hypothetical protein